MSGTWTSGAWRAMLGIKVGLDGRLGPGLRCGPCFRGCGSAPPEGPSIWSLCLGATPKGNLHHAKEGEPSVPPRARIATRSKERRGVTVPQWTPPSCSAGLRCEARNGRRDVYTVNHAVLWRAGHLTSPRNRWTGVQHPSWRACSAEMGGQTPHFPEIFQTTPTSGREFRAACRSSAAGNWAPRCRN